MYLMSRVENVSSAWVAPISIHMSSAYFIMRIFKKLNYIGVLKYLQYAAH
jgi:hypothetical protein